MLEPIAGGWRWVLRRDERRNSLDASAVAELHLALDRAEADGEARIFVLAGLPGVFCTGLDLDEVVRVPPPSEERPPFLELLGRFGRSRLVVVAAVDGVAIGGGVGLVAAADLALASARATFALTEALWGLVPAMVLPHLARRIGEQRAYELALTTRTIGADEALHVGLVDGVAEDLDGLLRERSRRLARIHPDTVGELKRYARRPVDDAEAGRTFTRLLAEPRVREGLRRFVEEGRVPWDRSDD